MPRHSAFRYASRRRLEDGGLKAKFVEPLAQLAGIPGRRAACAGSLVCRTGGSVEGDRRFLPIEVGHSYPYRLQLTPPLVYCPFPCAALNKGPEIDRFFGAVEHIGAEP